jgi:starch-binding outer membrane protein, SusD/RagB family
VSYGFYNATTMGFNVLPPDVGFPPSYYVSEGLLNSFEVGDRRKSEWINKSDYEGTTYYFPYKYKIGQAQQAVDGDPTEYYTVLRLAEQYLIRAEARARQGNISGAAFDLNAIRSRAGLSNTPAVTQQDLLAAIMHERRIELFSEWGHRWLDLKRTGQVDAIMAIATPLKNTGTTWQSYQQLYPIPLSQLELNPFLRQNPGYQ